MVSWARGSRAWHQGGRVGNECGSRLRAMAHSCLNKKSPPAPNPGVSRKETGGLSFVIQGGSSSSLWLRGYGARYNQRSVASTKKVSGERSITDQFDISVLQRRARIVEGPRRRPFRSSRKKYRQCGRPVVECNEPKSYDHVERQGYRHGDRPRCLVEGSDTTPCLTDGDCYGCA